MPHYQLLENIAIADIAFEAYGTTLEKVFEHAAEAIFDMMADVKKIKPAKKYILKFNNENLENLLFDFLNEIIYLKDTKYSIFKTVTVKITHRKKYYLTAALTGEKINPEKHELGNDIKAITMHQFSLKQQGKQWVARVVVDI
ncbi:MAG: archease [Nanoarchaeota archaeon]|nr:archease [Nanoarchaeota archaeon]